MIIQAHIFQNEQDCQNAIDLINQHLGLPNDLHDSHSHPQQNVDVWFIQADHHSIPILGEPEQMELIPKPLPE